MHVRQKSSENVCVVGVGVMRAHFRYVVNGLSICFFFNKYSVRFFVLSFSLSLLVLPFHSSMLHCKTIVVLPDNINGRISRYFKLSIASLVSQQHPLLVIVLSRKSFRLCVSSIYKRSHTHTHIWNG